MPRDTSPVPSWQECADAGMSQAEAARARGVSIQAASNAAKRLGLAFRSGRKDHAERMRKLHADPEFAAANAERMRRLNADPEFAAANAERMRKLHADPAFNPLVSLSPEERSDYDLMKKNKFTRDEALRAIGREDLIR